LCYHSFVGSVPDPAIQTAQGAAMQTREQIRLTDLASCAG
jgi:hypothetical protein